MPGGEHAGILAQGKLNRRQSNEFHGIAMELASVRRRPGPPRCASLSSAGDKHGLAEQHKNIENPKIGVSTFRQDLTW